MKKDYKKIKAAMKHPDVLGAGAEKRKKLNPDERASAVMEEYNKGTLRSGNGEHVKNEQQAKVIAISERNKKK